MKSERWGKSYESRRHFIGGSDARVIMGDNEAALLRLWREKRGEAEPEDLSTNLIVQLGLVTENLNLELNTFAPRRSACCESFQGISGFLTDF
jgi:predicted phage-related endonuclease